MLGGKKVGYMVFNQFFGQPSRNELAQAFTYFQGQGIDELVVDLRYNPGGSVETEDTLSNLIAPAPPTIKPCINIFSIAHCRTISIN
jgi:Periplasmic protease